jgi:hypothetical protein
MKIDLQGALIDAYNLKLTSKNIFLDCTSESGPYLIVKSTNKTTEKDNRNLIYVSDDEYYLQTSNYVSGTSGTKIDLTDGLIDSYQFTLTAGSATGKHLFLKSSPAGTDSDYYFNVGDTSSFIKFSGSGVLSIAASNFKLSAGDLTLSSYNSDNPIQVGNNFYVTWGGVLNATGAVVNGNITATYLTANEGGYIGGWSIGPNSLTSQNGATTLYSSGQLATSSGKFGVSTGGVLTATEANISGEITAKSGTIGGWTIGGAGENGGTTLVGGIITLDSTGKITVTDVCTIDSNGLSISKGDISLGGDATGGNFVVTNDGSVTIKSGSISIGAEEGGGSAFSVSSTGDVNITKGTIKVGDITLTSAGFYDGESAFPTASVWVWSWEKGARGVRQLNFLNGLLRGDSASDDEETSSFAVFDFTTSVDSKFKIGVLGAAWEATVTPDSGSIGVGAQDLKIDCVLNPPETLYTKKSGQSTVTK